MRGRFRGVHELKANEGSYHGFEKWKKKKKTSSPPLDEVENSDKSKKFEKWGQLVKMWEGRKPITPHSTSTSEYTPGWETSKIK